MRRLRRRNSKKVKGGFHLWVLAIRRWKRKGNRIVGWGSPERMNVPARDLHEAIERLEKYLDSDFSLVEWDAGVSIVGIVAEDLIEIKPPKPVRKIVLAGEEELAETA
jgi:hypothetical protein